MKKNSFFRSLPFKLLVGVIDDALTLILTGYAECHGIKDGSDN